MYISLPKTEGEPLLPTYFPTTMQAFVFRNWSMVAKERIALVLETTVENVENLAFGMGLQPQEDVSLWETRGYITIIRSNWHLLNYEQLLMLLDWTAERLALVLKEEDFLSEKLGRTKPQCEKITYRPLSEEEQAKTIKIRNVIEKLQHEMQNLDKASPFDFYSLFKRKTAEESDACIVDNTGDPLCQEAIRRFRKDLSQTVEKHSDKTLYISYLRNKEEEFHSIEISEDSVHISAGGYGGILRGLYRLLDMARTSGWKKIKKEWEPQIKLRCIYPFSASYQDIFEGDSSASCPDSLLEEYARIGINGIWLPVLLYRMVSFPFSPKLSEGYEMRVKNLRSFAKRAASFGIRVYLYLNEPRSMPLEAFRGNPDMMGTRAGDKATMCICHEKTIAYLESSISSLCSQVPELGGFFVISMAENLTLCKSKPTNFYDEMCPRCKDIPSWKLASTMHTALYNGMKKAAPHMEMFYFDWSWTREDIGMSPADADKCIRDLPEGGILLCQREIGLDFPRGGLIKTAREYALSVNGISPRSQHAWNIAGESGHRTAGKMQINTSWECSTVPYLPVFQRNIEQVEAMKRAGLNYIFFSWTLGGYPSPNIRLVSESFFTAGEGKPDYLKQLQNMYGENSECIWKATEHFSLAMEEYPFDKDFIYSGPSNGGVGNIFYENPTGRPSTMTCYTYDSLSDWAKIYPEDVLEEQYFLLSSEWERGLSYLEGMENEIRDISFATYIQFKSSYHQIRFIRLRDRFLSGDKTCRQEILSIAAEEEKIAREMFKIMCRRPSIGFEAANHYYLSPGMVMEKLVNLAHIAEHFRA